MKTLIFWVWAFWVPILSHLSKLHENLEFYAYEKDANARENLMIERRSKYFFPEITFGKNVFFVEDPKDIISSVDLIILIIPNQFVGWIITEMKEFLKPWVTFLNLSKWINNTTFETVSDTLRSNLWGFEYHYACLSGGMIASELALWKPLGADIWVSDLSLAIPLQNLFTSKSLTIRVTTEYKNIELFWALKNIFALYVGYLEGSGYGASTVGYHFCLLYEELKKFLPIIWGSSDINFWTFALGWDMIATCFGDSRNKYFWKLVGSWKTPHEATEILKSEKKHAEGYETLKGIKTFLEGKSGFDEMNKVIQIFLG